MKTKTMKILGVLLIGILIISMGASTVLAAASTPIDEVANKADKSNISTDKITDMGGKILKIAQTVGAVLAVLILTILGIKYMMGSAEEKAEYKKTMIPYIVGAVFIFAAPTIANIVYGFVNGL